MSSSNMAEIAREAGVAKATVSLALRNDPRLRPETRERIQKIAGRMGYKTNAVVASLMAQLRAGKDPKFQSTLALINAASDGEMPTTNATCQAWVRGCHDRAVELGYSLDNFWLFEPNITPARFRQIYRSRNIRGAVIVAIRSHRELPREFDDLWGDLACVVIGIRPERPALHFACNDQFSTALETAQQLAARGYSRPGLVIAKAIEEDVDFRFSAGFYGGHGRVRSQNQLPILDFKPDDRKGFFAWMEKHKPDAIVSTHKEVRTWIEERGLKIPGDVGLLHLDLTDELHGWSGMNQNNHLVGAAAIDLLVGQIHRNEVGTPSFPKCVMVESNWIDGETLRPRSKK
jgi:LacI family transcriptional regulator